MSDHAILSASSAHKWIHCPPSARLEAEFPDTKSEYAAEGTLAHAFGELRLRKQFTVMRPSEYKKQYAALQANPLYSPEMDGFIDVYFDYVNKLALSFPTVPFVAIEQRLDYSAYAPGGFGTGDNIIIYGQDMHVNDLKYGKGVPVSAEKNPQMMLYGLGAWLRYGFLHDIRRVHLTIIQPRLDTISTWTTTLEELLAWGESIKPLAQLAWEGKGLFDAGDHCQFCRARATCRERMNHFAQLEDWGRKQPPLITNEEIGRALAWGEGLAQWLKDLQDYALAECLAGRDVPGWKAVEGRSNRTITDYDAAIAAAKAAGFDEALFYRRSYVPMGDFEKLLGKSKEILAPFIVKPQGKPALAPAADKREPYTARTTAEQDFAQT